MINVKTLLDKQLFTSYFVCPHNSNTLGAVLHFK